MEKTITISKKLLQEALSATRTFVEKKNSMPILSHVLMSVFGITVEITATDMETTFRTMIPCINKYTIDSKWFFKVCIPCRKVFEIVRGVKDKEITLTLLSETDAEVPWILINNSFRVACLSYKEFPVWPTSGLKDLKTVMVPNLLNKLSRVSVAAGDDDTRYTLKTVCLDFEQGFISGTDGHRLHFENIPVYEGYGQILIPKPAIASMIKNKVKDTIQFSDKNCLVKVSNGLILSRLVEGTYPKIENVIPDMNNAKTRVLVSKDLLVNALDNALTMTRERTNQVKLTVNGCLIVSSSNPDIGEYQVKVPCKRDDSTHQDITIGFNARYLLEGLKEYPNQDTILDIDDSVGPCLINGHAVVMPMRV